MALLENIQDLVMNPIMNMDVEAIGDVISESIYNLSMGLSVISTLAITFAIFTAVLVASVLIIFSILMRTPVRPYLVDVLGLKTKRTLSEYKASKKVKK